MGKVFMEKCDVCSERAPERLWHVRGYDIVRCPQCGLVYADVTTEDIRNAYELDYYKQVYPDYETDRNIHERNSSKLLEEIEKTHAPGSLIEIGSAFGFFLHTAQQRGWKTCGYELSQYASSIAREKYSQNVRTEDFLTACVDTPVDVVCMFDTIEHLLRPSQYIEKVNRVLRGNGALIITTGDLSSLLSRISGQKWRMVMPPLHVYYFSRKTLTRLLERHGFRVISIRHEWKYQNLNSILKHQFGIDKRFVPRIPIPINLGDIMLVRAVKIQDVGTQVAAIEKSLP